MRIGTLHFRLHQNSGAEKIDIPDRKLLSQAIEVALRDTLLEDDEGYWVIRRIALPFRAEPRFGMNGIAEEFALALRDRIGRVLRGEDINGVRRYPSRSHWLADCIWTQAQGDAHDAWQFGRYRHHAALPAADAVRLILVEEAANAVEALGMLARDGRIRPFCKYLDDAGVRGILTLLTTSRPSMGGVLDPGLVKLLDEEAARSPDRPNTAKLAALARHADRRPGTSIPDATQLNRAFTLSIASIGKGPRSADLLVPNSHDTARPGEGHGASRQSMQDGHGVEAQISLAGTSTAAITPIKTGFAGVFVLWRSVCELGFPDLLPTGAAGGPARLALASAMAGPEHALAWCDPALHWLADYRPESGELAPLPPPELATRFVRHYRDERGFRGLTPTITKIGRTSLLQDQHSEDWLALGSRRQCERAARLLNAVPSAPLSRARDPRVDLDWFDVHHRRARRPWVMLARAAYGDFGRRLHGLAGASAAWLWNRLLAGEGLLEFGSPATVHLPRAQLDLVLRMGGLDGTLVATPSGDIRLKLPGAE